MIFIRKTSLVPKEGYTYSPTLGLYQESDDTLRKRIKKALNEN